MDMEIDSLDTFSEIPPPGMGNVDMSLKTPRVTGTAFAQANSERPRGTIDLLNASAEALSHLNLNANRQSPRKQQIDVLCPRGYNATEARLKLKNDMKMKLEHEAQKSADGLTCNNMPPQQRLCMSMLSSGKPKAFVEFFNLTFSNKVEVPSEENVPEKVLSHQHLSELSENLVAAELATRSGDFESLFHINIKIGAIFEDSGDFGMAVFYFAKGLNCAQQTGNASYEAKVKFGLGRVCVKLHDYPNAIRMFEDYLVIVQDFQEKESVILGAIHLLQVYQMAAKEARDSENLELSVDLYQKSIEMADICGNIRAKAEAKHEIGLLHEKLSNFDLSLEYQQVYLVYCLEENDKVGQSKAYASLATTHELLGNLELAINDLEALLEVSKHVNLETQVVACCKLGMIYSKQQMYEKSLEYFESFFKLACVLNEPKLIDTARLNMGFVKNMLSHNCLKEAPPSLPVTNLDWSSLYFPNDYY